MTDADIIDALGRSRSVANALELAQSTVSNWRARGIPWRHRLDIKELARRRKVSLPADFMRQRV